MDEYFEYNALRRKKLLTGGEDPLYSMHKMSRWYN